MEKFTCREKIAFVIGNFLAYKVGNLGANWVNWANQRRKTREAHKEILRAIVGDDWADNWEDGKDTFK